MGEQEKDVNARDAYKELFDDAVGAFVEVNQLRKRLAEVEASEERLADIVRRSLELHCYVYDNPRTVASGYHIDARVALEKRPRSR